MWDAPPRARKWSHIQLIQIAPDNKRFSQRTHTQYNNVLFLISCLTFTKENEQKFMPWNPPSSVGDITKKKYKVESKADNDQTKL